MALGALEAASSEENSDFDYMSNMQDYGCLLLQLSEQAFDKKQISEPIKPSDSLDKLIKHVNSNDKLPWQANECLL